MTPGTYLRLRREAAGLSIEDLALRIDTDVKVSARSRAELLDLIETDTAVIGADVVKALQDLRALGAFAFDRHVLWQLIAIHAGAEIPAPEICNGCGCSWNDACADLAAGGFCGWATRENDWCTVCANRAVDAALQPASAAA